MPGTPHGRQVEPAHETLRIRIGCFVLLAIVLHAWLLTHADIDVTKLAVADAAAALIVHLVSVLRKREVAALRVASREAVLWLVQPRTLAVTVIAFAALGSFWSTGIVFPVKNLSDVSASADTWPCFEERHLRTPNDEWRFHCFTTPFGRDVRIASVSQLYSVHLYPWVPRIIRVKTPTILVRVPDEQFEAAEGATIEIWNGNRRLVAKTTSSREAAILVGPQQLIPREMKDKWRDELLASGYRPDIVMARVQAWNVSTAVELPEPITAGIHLRVTLLGPEKNKLVETPDYGVTVAPLQEIHLGTPQPNRRSR